MTQRIIRHLYKSRRGTRLEVQDADGKFLKIAPKNFSDILPMKEVERNHEIPIGIRQCWKLSKLAWKHLKQE